MGHVAHKNSEGITKNRLQSSGSCTAVATGFILSENRKHHKDETEGGCSGVLPVRQAMYLVEYIPDTGAKRVQDQIVQFGHALIKNELHGFDKKRKHKANCNSDKEDFSFQQHWK